MKRRISRHVEIDYTARCSKLVCSTCSNGSIEANNSGVSRDGGVTAKCHAVNSDITT